MFRIDGEANHMQLNVRFNDMAIKSAEYLGGSSSNEVILGGRRPYFYSYDIESGAMAKVLGCTGKNIKSHEGLSVSPAAADGSGKGYIAIQGISGYVHVMCAQQKTWITDVKIPSGGGVRAVHFIDENTLCASGGDAEVYVWDLRSSRMGGGCRVVQRWGWGWGGLCDLMS
jgi:U3 small nucleolar RNA-associated protein 18